ncbi:MAG: glycosyltransferase [Acidimicrobiales bacterium]
MSDHSTSEHSIPHRQGGQPTVAYVLKGYPRISELFIASEIYRLEQLGVALRIIVIKPSEETTHHPIVDLIEAVPTYLPATSSLSGTGLPRWLRENLRFVRRAAPASGSTPPGRGVPRGGAGSGPVRSCPEGRRPRAIYAKEFLLAVALVDTLDAAGDVEHLHAHFAHGCTTVTWLASIISGTSLHRSCEGHLPVVAEPGRPARSQASSGRLHAHLHGRQRGSPPPDRAIGRRSWPDHGLNAEFTKLLVDAPPFHPPCDRPRIISVGRLVPKKGFDVLVKAVAELGDVELVIAGEDGDQADVVRELVRSLDLADRVTLRGAVTQAQLVEEYRSSSMFRLGLPCG